MDKGACAEHPHPSQFSRLASGLLVSESESDLTGIVLEEDSERFGGLSQDHTAVCSQLHQCPIAHTFTGRTCTNSFIKLYTWSFKSQSTALFERIITTDKELQQSYILGGLIEPRTHWDEIKLVIKLQLVTTTRFLWRLQGKMLSQAGTQTCPDIIRGKGRKLTRASCWVSASLPHQGVC